ncbi:hypothetical protein FRACYDRAFT_264052 [Fragilariopsis cylindrus CCMP1102]|uniref:Tyrosine specific protein phosphatases domain-containing protein n=1 Tax=Fragilariopsis cylindrus CCMP1102 TaxID=635003 RepID=A0A1E7EV50_9STRA|nr:hypothetical protein FRACYDRAFT_264052 [Fragilariopsis cylindrus CCMP1102]|eukprot:OEU09727.1 hypothetical protein FRACYDRAFT_264052 [Fragilariopsis cylindrus CCMP1102]
MTMTSSSSNRIRNFRPASGFNIALEDDDDETDDEKSAVSSSSATAARLASSTVYRCGSTDVLGRELNISGSSSLSSSFTTTTDDQIVFQHAGLIIDLRSPAERNEKDAQRWMDAATAGSAQQHRSDHNEKKKNITETQQQHIQTNDDDDTSIVIHCVQGKDRTGMLVMLMQLLMGNTIISDEEIIEDYYRSNSNAVIKSKHCRRNEGSVTATASSAAAAAIVVVDGGGGNDNDNDKSLARIIKIDKRVFSGTNREAMISTLEGLRRRYGYNNDEGEDGSTRFGSFDRTVPRYFDLIGFNDSWRKRFRNVFIKKKKNNTGNNIRRSRLKVATRIFMEGERTTKRESVGATLLKVINNFLQQHLSITIGSGFFFG